MSKEVKKKRLHYGKVYLFLTVLFLAGVVLALIGRMCGARTVEFEKRTKNLTGQSVMSLTEDELRSVKNLSIDVGVTSLTMEQGEHFEIIKKEVGSGIHIGKHRLFEASELQYEIDDDTLYITDNSPEGVLRFFGNSTITIPLIGNIGNANKYEIILPENLSLDDVDIDTGAGSISVEELQAKDVNVDIGAGEIRFDKVTCDDFSTDVGAGEIRIGEMYSAGSVVMEMSMGEIRIEDGEYRNVQADVSMGELRMAGKMEGENSFDCSMGEIRLQLEHPRDYYSISASKAMGEIYIDGSEKGDYESEGQDGSSTIEADVSMGEIHMEFQ